jgi:hypothetical protein
MRSHAAKISRGRTLSPKRVLARKKAMAELSLRGWTATDIGTQFNLGKDRILQLLRQADDEGLIDDVRHEMVEKLLPLSKAVYEHVLTTPAADLTADVKAHELKLKAARQVTERLMPKPNGKREDRFTAKLSMTYDEFMKSREARLAAPVPGTPLDQLAIIEGVMLNVGDTRNHEPLDGQLRRGADGAAEGDAGVADGVSSHDADSARQSVEGIERRGDDQGGAGRAGGLPEQAAARRRADVSEDVAGADVDPA